MCPECPDCAVGTACVVVADSHAVAADGAQQHHQGDVPVHGTAGGTPQVSASLHNHTLHLRNPSAILSPL